MVGKVLLNGAVAGFGMGLATSALVAFRSNSNLQAVAHLLVASSAFWTVTILLLVGIYALAVRLLYGRKGE